MEHHESSTPEEPRGEVIFDDETASRIDLDAFASMTYRERVELFRQQRSIYDRLAATRP